MQHAGENNDHEGENILPIQLHLSEKSLQVSYIYPRAAAEYSVPNNSGKLSIVWWQPLQEMYSTFRTFQTKKLKIKMCKKLSENDTFYKWCPFVWQDI